LWASFLLKTRDLKIYVGGDSGYDTHFSEIAKKFGPIDLAILNCGQYNKRWQHAHLLIDEVIKAAKDLQVKTLFPVHVFKISLAPHAWDAPYNDLLREAENEKFLILTPMIGEKINLKFPRSEYAKWWKTGTANTKTETANTKTGNTNTAANATHGQR
jgi:L-ascorbate metabolism protein UlaG (beta-lactamase superfamily)